MKRFLVLITAIAALLLCAGSTMASSVSIKLSGPGAVNDSTIKAGEKVSFDIYILNDGSFTCFSMGFKISSSDIAVVAHPADSGNGKNSAGDVKAFGGFEDASIFDLGGLYVVESDWDGKLPDLIGFGGLCAHKSYDAHENGKRMSFDLLFDGAGTVVVDSSFFPPGGQWVFAQPKHAPAWGGPYTFQVVK